MTSASNSFAPPDTYQAGTTGDSRADSRTGEVYVFNDRIRLAIRIALATGRPLLVRGESGWGKSSLAAATARYLNWDFLETIITSQTQARDLQWEVDLLLRLSDSQGGQLDPNFGKYIRPRVLWWAFQAGGAYEQQKLYDSTRKLSPELSGQPLTRGGTVVLIDEIDKADPDVPNNLLVALGSLQFKVEETGQTIHADKARPHLIFITTNEERELPAAFLRRCIAITLPALPGDDRDGSMRKKLLVDIVLAHGLTHASQQVSRPYVEGIAQMLIPAPKSDAEAVVPSPAEFKDTVLALVDRYGAVNVPESALEEIAQMTLSKRWRSN